MLLGTCPAILVCMSRPSWRGRPIPTRPAFVSEYVDTLDDNWSKVDDVRSTFTYIVRHNVASLIARDPKTTVDTLAETSGVSSQAIWHVLHGRMEFNNLGLEKISQALNVEALAVKTQGAFYPVGDEDEINCYTNAQYAQSCIMCSPENFSEMG